MGAERTTPDGESLLAEQLLPARGSAVAAGHDFERSRSAALQDVLDQGGGAESRRRAGRPALRRGVRRLPEETQPERGFERLVELEPGDAALQAGQFVGPDPK